ncbi:hypothetical protein AMTRI_Chr02g266700 [Amborella trichopoda]
MDHHQSAQGKTQSQELSFSERGSGNGDGNGNGNGEGGGRWEGTWVMGIPANPHTQPPFSSVGVPQQSPSPSPNKYYSYDSAAYLPHYNSTSANYNVVTPQPQAPNPYVHTSPVSGSSGKSPMDTIMGCLSKWGKKVEESSKKAEGYAGNVWHHLKTGPSLTDAAMARINQGTKVLAEGGVEKVFRQTFETLPGEQLRKSFVCYFSTSSGPVIGTLYLSTVRLAFCSDNPLCYCPAPGRQEWIYYKVVVLLDQLMAVTPSANRLNPAEKYIQVLTRDGHEFWFMGFVSYDKALKNLTEALYHASSYCSGGNSS